MKSKKILIITLIIILVLTVVGTTLAYLYIATDTFKSDEELFGKYISQNAETLEKFKDSQIIKTYNGLNEQEKYDSNTDVKFTYSEGGEVSNQINNFSANFTTKKDNSEQYFYADGQVLLGDQKYLESEIIKDNESYGVRFTDVAKQFITIKNDSNLESVATNLGTDEVTLKKYMDIIDGVGSIDEEIISQEDVQQLRDKYMQLITNAVSSGTFSSNKKAQITYNNTTTSAKAYTVSLTSEQVENMLIDILNNIKDDEQIKEILNDNPIVKSMFETYASVTTVLHTDDADKDGFTIFIENMITSIQDEQEAPTIRITVYEQNGITIRTVVEIGQDKVVVENTEENGELKSNIQFTEANTEQIENYDIELAKKNENKNEDFDVNIDVTSGDNEYTISFTNEMTVTDSSIKFDSSTSYKKDILIISMDIENNTSIGENVEKEPALSNDNEFNLNDANEETRNNIISQLKERVQEKLTSRINLLQENLGLSTNGDNVTSAINDSEMTQIEVNQFNAKFEFYTGDEVTAENVKALLEIVKDNLDTCEITPVNDSDGTDSTQITDPSQMKYTIKLNIKRNNSNEDAVNQALEKIDDNKKYKISISYKEQNNLIDYITIEEVTT